MSVGAGETLGMKGITLVFHSDAAREATDAPVEALARAPATAPEHDVDWSRAAIALPAKKKAISIRVDEDVLEFFKTGGAGYQRRINAVLRSYMEQKRKLTPGG
jgi:uncharacterized protein (DUF4415 family)